MRRHRWEALAAVEWAGALVEASKQDAPIRRYRVTARPAPGSSALAVLRFHETCSGALRDFAKVAEELGIPSYAERAAAGGE